MPRSNTNTPIYLGVLSYFPAIAAEHGPAAPRLNTIIITV